MQANNPVELSSQQRPDQISLMAVLREAPLLLERLPPAALKNLSTTCKSLRRSFCARVKVITLSEPADACKVTCNTWPQLMMLVCTCELEWHSDPEQNHIHLQYWQKSGCLRTLPELPDEWEYMMQVQVETAWDTKTAALLIRPCQQLYAPVMDLSSQHCAALSGFADKYRPITEAMSLHGPLVTCRAVQSLTHGTWPLVTRLTLFSAPQLGVESISYLSGSLQSLLICTIKYTSLDAVAVFQKGMVWPQLRCLTFRDNQLDADAISAMKHANWTDLHHFSLTNNMLGKLGIQYIVSCSWPLLVHLALEHAGIEGPDLQYLVNSQWPALEELSLDGNSIDACGVSYLVQGSWPLLNSLILSDRSLDAEAYSLLGIAEVDRIYSYRRRAFHCWSDLPQFPDLRVCCRSHVREFE